MAVRHENIDDMVLYESKKHKKKQTRHNGSETCIHLISPPIHVVHFQQIPKIHIILSACPLNLAEVVISRVIGLSSILRCEATLITSWHTSHKFVDVIPISAMSTSQINKRRGTVYQSSKIPALRPAITVYHLCFLALGVETRRDGVWGSGRAGVYGQMLEVFWGIMFLANILVVDRVPGVDAEMGADVAGWTSTHDCTVCQSFTGEILRSAAWVANGWASEDELRGMSGMYWQGVAGLTGWAVDWAEDWCDMLRFAVNIPGWQTDWGTGWVEHGHNVCGSSWIFSVAAAKSCIANTSCIWLVLMLNQLQKS